MFKKGPDIDKKKLLAKASDVKLDSLTRLKHFNTIIAHSDLNETHSLFKTHFTFIYDTFIETFSTFDYNSKQRRDDLECILFIFEKIIIYKPELIKNDLLQVFVLNSSNAFLTKVENITMLDEQFKMCKRIMNIYRYMVMKIYLNKSTWKQLLEVMLMITEQLFPVVPPERRESTIGGRIAPAFFQTFIVSWIRANLYVHISSQMWYKFYDIMRDLVGWRELVEEWSTLMGSLTRVLVKHVYGLSLTDLPLDRPQGGRRRPKALKSFSTTDGGPASATDHNSPSSSNSLSTSSRRSPIQTQRPPRSGSVRLPNFTQRGQTSGLTRSNSDGLMFHQLKLYYSSSMSANNQSSTPDKMRKIKSEYLILTSELGLPSCVPSDPGIDGISLKDSMILEQDQNDSHHSGKSSMDSSFMSHKSTGKRSESRSSSDKCVLLGGSIRGWTSENSVIMWRRMLGLFGNINQIEDPEIHLIAMKCLAVILNDFMKTRDNLGISLDNQSTPEQPSLIPPYTFLFGWLLEATHLPDQFSKSRSIAYSLLCTVIIRRHDIELSQQYYITFYEAIQRGLSLPDISVHAAIIQNSTQLLSLELPGCTFLVQGLYERSRSLLLSSGVGQRTPDKNEARSKDQAVQILNAILSLNRPIKKLMVLKSEVANNSMNLVAPGDIKAKVFDTLLAYNNRPIILDSHTRSRSLCSLAIHVYHELCDKNDGPDVDKLFDTIMTVLQDASNSILFRINCDLLRLFVDHATTLTRSRPDLVSSMIRTVCQLVVRLGADENHKESIQYLLMCLEDWCMAVSKSFLLKPMEQPAFVQREDNLSIWPSDSLLTIVLRSLESVVHGEQYLDDASNRGIRNSVNLSKNLDTQVSGRQTQAKGAPSPSGSHRTLVNNEQHTNRMHQQSQDANVGSPIGNSKNLEAIKLACKVSHLKLNTYLGHYPFKQIGPASMSCCVNELDHLTANDQEASDLKNLSGVLMLVIDGNTLISFIGATRNSDGLCQPIHLIIRNLCGKYSWDASCIESSVYKQPIIVDSSEKSSTMFDSDSYQEAASRSSAKYDSDFNDDGHSTSSYSSRASLGRDCIGDLLNQLTCSIASANGHSMSSPSQNMQRSKRNSAQSISNPRFKIAQAEETMIALLTNQRFQELNHCEKSDDTDRKNMAKTNAILGMGGDKLTEQFNPSANSSRIVSFEQCRQLIQQLGYLTWEKRCKIDSLTKSPRLMRELKNLDAQPGRETHKIAVIYVANGQEDKNSILANSNGSRAFEEFVAGLGWEVNLASHLGFKGGLQANKSTGETAPYYCTATTEVMFHVSTKIPVNKPVDDESLKRKLCHLGNDEIHIVWSEHVRDYRRGIIPTEFGDVIIAIYPMLTFQGYYRVQITSNQDVPQFGPLFDNCIVHQTSLAPLVRATAINASRAKRLRLPYFLAHYEERSRLIESIVQNHREKQSFEEFASQLYANSELNCSQHQQQQQGLTSQDHQCCT